MVSASHSARSPTRVGSAAANAVEAVVRGAAGERAIRSAIASQRSRSASPESGAASGASRGWPGRAQQAGRRRRARAAS